MTFPPDIQYKIVIQNGSNSSVNLFLDRSLYEQAWARQRILFESMKDTEDFNVRLKAFIYKDGSWRELHSLG